MSERLRVSGARQGMTLLFGDQWMGFLGDTLGEADCVRIELDRLYAAAEANQAPGPDWKAKLRGEVEVLRGQDAPAGSGYDRGVWDMGRWVLRTIDALPDPPTPDPDAPPVYEPPEGHYIVLGGDVPDGWEGRRYESDPWWKAAWCRDGHPTTLFEVRRVPAPEPATEWVPLTKLVGRTIDGCNKPCDGHPTYDDVFDNWMWRNGPSWMVIPPNKLNLDTAQVLVLAEGER